MDMGCCNSEFYALCDRSLYIYIYIYIYFYYLFFFINKYDIKKNSQLLFLCFVC